MRRTTGTRDQGSAVVEFLGLTLVLLIPLVYLVLVLGRLEAAAFAVEGAARESARAYVAADDDEDGARRAVAATALAIRDQGFDDDPTDALAITCDGPCLTPGGEVTASVQVVVPLPFVPDFARDALPLEIPVSATRSAPVDEFRAGG